jgi:hypothetical protein
MTSLNKCVCLLLIVCAVACGKKKDGGGGGGDNPGDDADKFFLESVQKDLAAVKDALAKGGDPQFKCAGAAVYAEDLTKHKVAGAEAVVKELTKLCGYDAPLAALEAATKKAETARAAKPNDNPLSECFSAGHDTAVADLTKAGFANDDKVKAIGVRWSAACPAK